MGVEEEEFIRIVHARGAMEEEGEEGVFGSRGWGRFKACSLILAGSCVLYVSMTLFPPLFTAARCPKEKREEENTTHFYDCRGKCQELMLARGASTAPCSASGMELLVGDDELRGKTRQQAVMSCRQQHCFKCGTERRLILAMIFRMRGVERRRAFGASASLPRPALPRACLERLDELCPLLRRRAYSGPHS